jgi:alkanesulfonate monooxygenase SsuD/methylene tetrahydromethanopterin reductase-like flavin-dependent oxidoreductase (luciferase family)
LPRVEITANLGENDFDPEAFVNAAVYAEELGYKTAWFGDHIFPWYHSGKRSAFIWSVLPTPLS